MSKLLSGAVSKARCLEKIIKMLQLANEEKSLSIYIVIQYPKSREIAFTSYAK